MVLIVIPDPSTTPGKERVQVIWIFSWSFVKHFKFNLLTYVILMLSSQMLVKMSKLRVEGAVIDSVFLFRGRLPIV